MSKGDETDEGLRMIREAQVRHELAQREYTYTPQYERKPKMTYKDADRVLVESITIEDRMRWTYSPIIAKHLLSIIGRLIYDIMRESRVVSAKKHKRQFDEICRMWEVGFSSEGFPEGSYDSVERLTRKWYAYDIADKLSAIRYRYCNELLRIGAASGNEADTVAWLLTCRDLCTAVHDFDKMTLDESNKTLKQYGCHLSLERLRYDMATLCKANFMALLHEWYKGDIILDDCVSLLRNELKRYNACQHVIDDMSQSVMADAGEPCDCDNCEDCPNYPCYARREMEKDVRTRKDKQNQ